MTRTQIWQTLSNGILTLIDSDLRIKGSIKYSRIWRETRTKVRDTCPLEMFISPGVTGFRADMPMFRIPSDEVGK